MYFFSRVDHFSSWTTLLLALTDADIILSSIIPLFPVCLLTTGAKKKFYQQIIFCLFLKKKIREILKPRGNILSSTLPLQKQLVFYKGIEMVRFF